MFVAFPINQNKVHSSQIITASASAIKSEYSQTTTAILSDYLTLESVFLANEGAIFNDSLAFTSKTLVQSLYPRFVGEVANIPASNLKYTSETLYRQQYLLSRLQRPSSVYGLIQTVLPELNATSNFEVNASSSVVSSNIKGALRVYTNRTLPVSIQRYETKFRSWTNRWSTKSVLKQSTKTSNTFPISNQSTVAVKAPNLKLWLDNSTLKNTASALRLNEYGQPLSFSDVRNLLAFLTGSRVSIHRINALSLTRYAFEAESKTFFDAEGIILANNSALNVVDKDKDSSSELKSSYRFLRSLEQERVSRFQYVAVYIQDLVRVSFISIYLKKADFLANFLAFTLSKLPRNRKETQFLRFLRKVVKVFASQRKERIGLRLRFQGRVNRWRRTKHIIGEKGRIPFYSYRSRIEYGAAQAITRKGTFGIRVWLCYQPSFSKAFHNSFLQYVRLK